MQKIQTGQLGAKTFHPLASVQKIQTGQLGAKTFHPLASVQKIQTGQLDAKTFQPSASVQKIQTGQLSAKTFHPSASMEKIYTPQTGQLGAKTFHPSASIEKIYTAWTRTIRRKDISRKSPELCTFHGNVSFFSRRWQSVVITVVTVYIAEPSSNKCSNYPPYQIPERFSTMLCTVYIFTHALGRIDWPCRCKLLIAYCLYQYWLGNAVHQYCIGW